MKFDFTRIAALAALAVLTFSACGKIDDNNLPDNITDSAVDSVTDSSESVPEPAPTPDTSSPDDSVNNISIELNTYTAADVPELLPVINDTLTAAAGTREEFEAYFDTDLIVEVLVRSSTDDEEKIKKTLETYTEEVRKKTAEQNYDLIHDPLVNNPCEGEIENLTLQCYNTTLDESMIFDLNFDMKCKDGMVTFIGCAYKLNGKWGAMFEPTEYKGDDGGIDLSSMMTAE